VEALPDDEYILDQDYLPHLVPQPGKPSISATFSDYISDLPPWEQNLFESLDMFYTCYEIVDLIHAAAPDDTTLDIHLISVSNGLAFDRSMSFGWTMSLPNNS
jgi:hypothetical protein